MMMMRVGHIGMGDFSAPDCTPGDPNCVPHWYCYIPFMATPDCLASFAQGTKQIVQGATSAATGTVAAAVGGTVAGAVQGTGQGTCVGLLGAGQFAQQICKNPAVSILTGAAIFFGLIVILKKGKG